VPKLGSVDSVRSVCATDDYKAHTIYEKDSGRLNAGMCVSAPKSFEFFAWDSYGRFTFKTDTPKKLGASEGWEFYDNIKPWINSNTQKCFNDNCVISEFKRLSKHPKMIAAVEEWKSSILYR